MCLKIHAAISNNTDTLRGFARRRRRFSQGRAVRYGSEGLRAGLESSTSSSCPGCSAPMSKVRCAHQSLIFPDFFSWKTIKWANFILNSREDIIWSLRAVNDLLHHSCLLLIQPVGAFNNTSGMPWTERCHENVSLYHEKWRKYKIWNARRDRSRRALWTIHIAQIWVDTPEKGPFKVSQYTGSSS